MLHHCKPLLATHEPCIDKLRPYNIYSHLGGGGVLCYVWNGGGLVGFWWSGGNCIPLSGVLVGRWHFGGVFEWYLNGSFNEFCWGSVWEFCWGVAGLSGFRMVGWDSLSSIGTPPVSCCLCMWCGFSLFSNDLLTILIKSLHGVLAWHVRQSSVSLI